MLKSHGVISSSISIFGLRKDRRSGGCCVERGFRKGLVSADQLGGTAATPKKGKRLRLKRGRTWRKLERCFSLF